MDKPALHIGASYYPEHWPRQRWEDDARLMAEIGFNVVRMGEFGWGRFEPADGRFDFGWMVDAVRLFAAHGIRTILCTPTAAPPRWLVRAHPDVLPVDASGRRATPDARKHASFHSPHYIERSRRIVEAQSDALGDEPGVLAWQVDNELGGHGQVRDYSDSAEAGFRDWLRRRYGTIEALNAAWGNAFWSQQVNDWSEVTIPRPTMGGRGPANPGALLDYCRFSSDVAVGFLRMQAEILQARSPGRPITTNLMPIGDHGLDYAAMVECLGFTSWDNYQQGGAAAGFHHDYMRSAAADRRPFWVMEQKAGPPDGPTVTRLDPDGAVSALAAQAIALGGRGIVFFPWRQCPFGAEQAHAGILDHSGAADTRVLGELRRTVPQLKAFAQSLADARPASDVAILLDYPSWWTVSPDLPHRVKRRPAEADYRRLVASWHQAAFALGLAVDVAPPGTDLSAYRLVVLPALRIVPEVVAAALRRFAAGGGTIIVTALSDVADGHGRLLPRRGPAQLGAILGVEAAEMDCPPQGADTWVRWPDGTRHQATTVCERLVLRHAEVLAVFDFGAGEPSRPVLDGLPAVTRAAYGQGAGVYVATCPEVGLARQILAQAASSQRIPLVDALPAGVTFRRQRAAAGELAAVVNHNSHAVAWAWGGRNVELGAFEFRTLGATR